MTCDVCIYQEGDSTAEFSNEHLIAKARKAAKCDECRRPIAIGSSYWKIVGKWEGELMTFRQCEPCYEIQHTFCCDGWIYGELWEGMRDQAFENLTMSGECWDELTPRSKEFLLEKWREWKFDL